MTGDRQSTPTDTQLLREEIAQTRADLGETAAALAAKADVKARAKTKASEVAGRAAAVAVAARARASREAALTQHQLKNGDVVAVVRRPLPMAALAAVVSGAILAVIIRGRRSRAT